MISNVTFSLDLTYTNPVTGALQPRGIVRDLTDYNGIGLSPVIFELKALGRIAFNGDVIVEKDNILDPLIDLQNWDFSEGVPTYTFDLPLDLNGNVANGIYQFLYQLRVNTPFGIQVLGSFAVTDTQFESDGSLWAADFLEIGNTISLDPDEQTVSITAIELDDPDGVIYTVTPDILNPGTVESFSFDITNTQVSATYVYSGCTQTTADVSFTYDCEVGDSGSWAVANTTALASNEVISTLNCTVSYPSWTALTPTFNPQVVLTSLPYPSAPNTETPLATGTYTVSLTEQILQTQTDGLILQYSTSTIQEFVVSCSGSLCGLTPCIESLRVAHANELHRNRISKYQVFVDNVLLYYAEAQNYRACGDTANYRATLELIKQNLDSSGCECACCDDNVYYWVSNNSGVSVIDSLVQSFQFRLFNLTPVGPGSPLATNDVTQGVEVGALWENVETGVIYRCDDNEAGAAVWELYFEPGGSFTAADIEADILVNLTANNVQGQLDQIDTLAVFDGINGLNKVGNDVRLGGVLDSATTINCSGGALTLLGGGLILNIETVDGPASRMTVEQASTNTVAGNLLVETTTTGGAGANGIGAAIWLRAQDAFGAMVTAGKVISTWVDALIGNSNLQLTSKIGGVESTGITLNPDSSVTFNKYGDGDYEGSVLYMLGVTGAGLIQEVTVPKTTTYVARINQAGTADPVLTVIHNDTSLTITAARNAAGNYQLTSAGYNFDAASTMVLISNGDISTVTRDPIVVARVTSNRVVIKTKFAAAATLQDDVLEDAYIEIRIYE